MGLSVQSLSVTLGGAKVLRDVSAALLPGQVTAILGPNGAGKSSLIRCLAGLLPPAAGRVTLDGADLATLDSRTCARRIGYLPQATELAWNLPAREIVALGRHPWRSPFAAPSPADAGAIAAAMAATDTSAFADRLVKDLSGGERARVLLARVLAGRPEWILADEPLASLDPAHQRAMLTLLARAAAGGAGVVLIVHDLNHALRIADRVLLLRDGQLRHDGTAAETLTPSAIAEIFDIAVERIPPSAGARAFLRPLG